MLKKIKKSILISLLSLSILAGCGKDSPQPVTINDAADNTPDIFYDSEFLAIPSGQVGAAHLSRDGIYFLEDTADADNTLIRTLKYLPYESQNAGASPAENVYLESKDENSDKTILQFFVDETGLYALYSPSASENKEFLLEKYDTNGKMLVSGSLSIENLNNPNAAHFARMEDDNGNPLLYLNIGDKLLILDENDSFREKGHIDGAERGDILCDGERVWYLENRTDGVQVHIYDTADERKATDFAIHYVCGSFSDGFMYLSDGMALYEVDLASLSCEKLLHWSDYGITGQDVTEFSVSDGSIIGIEQGSKPSVFFLRESDQLAEDIVTLRLATREPNTAVLQQIISGFVKANPRYRIEVMDLGNENRYLWTPIEDSMEKLNTMIISDTPPDLIDVRSLDWESYAGNGVLEDLYGYLDRSTVLDRSLFLEHVLHEYETNGILPTIPISFTLSGYVAKESIVGSHPIWTVDSIRQILESHPGMTLNGSYPYMCMFYLVGIAEDTLVDEENGVCHFDSEEFKEILQMSMEYSVPTDPADLLKVIDEDMLFRQNQSLIRHEDFSNITSLQSLNQLYEERVTFVGSPTGVPRTSLSGDGLYAICSASTQKDDAWKFMEYFLSTDPEENIYFAYHTPSRKDYLEKRLDAASTPDYMTDENGEYIYDELGERIQVPKVSNQGKRINGKEDKDIYAATDEDIVQLYECIENATRVHYGDSQIDNMIREEAEAYFAGQKSVDEVAEIIQSRVQLFLNENK